MLRTTTTYTFWTCSLTKMVRDRQIFTLLTWKCASRHNGVLFSTCSLPNVIRCCCVLHIFYLQMCFAPHRRAIVHLSSGPVGSAPAALESLLFDPPEPQWKNTVNRAFPTCSRTCIFFLLTLLLWCLRTSWLLLSDSSHLCFPICP